MELTYYILLITTLYMLITNSIKLDTIWISLVLLFGFYSISKTIQNGRPINLGFFVKAEGENNNDDKSSDDDKVERQSDNVDVHRM